jgi:hypothetical protein
VIPGGAAPLDAGPDLRKLGMAGRGMAGRARGLSGRARGLSGRARGLSGRIRFYVHGRERTQSPGPSVRSDQAPRRRPPPEPPRMAE